VATIKDMPGTKWRESMPQGKADYSLYTIFLFYRSHNIILPLSSALAIRLSVSLKAIAVTGFFCFIVNIIFEFLIFSTIISPESKQTATISINGVGRTICIFLPSRLYFKGVQKSNNIF
jgi:hypothetical protein